MARQNRDASGYRRGAGTKPNRHEGRRNPRLRFLIVCEGEKTEPNYFRAFRRPGQIFDVRGFGVSPRRLVDKAIQLRQEESYDQVWCVFDKDDCPADDFNGAIQKAKNNHVRMAYSNQAFELWYLLHFHYYNTAVSRQDYANKLSALLGKAYKKNDPDMHQLLASRQQAALQNATRLMAEYADLNPSTNDPSTTVHELVKALTAS